MPDKSTHHALMKKGFQFDQYRIVRLLGRGGMGEVYEVEHRAIQQRFALKLILERLSSRPGVKEHFARERRAKAALPHPNPLKVKDFRETDRRR